MSISVTLMIIYDFYHGYEMIRVHATKMISEKKVPKELEISKNDEFILEKYTEGVELDTYGVHSYLTLIENIRFFIMQLIIAGLQLLNRTQALLVFLLNQAFFIYFIRLVFTRKIFSFRLLKINMIVQECSILVLILAITLFSFTEDTRFSSSGVYKAIELISIISILGAIGSQSLVMLSSLYDDLKKICGKNKDKSKEIWPSKELAKNDEKGHSGKGRETTQQIPKSGQKKEESDLKKLFKQQKNRREEKKKFLKKKKDEDAWALDASFDSEKQVSSSRLEHWRPRNSFRMRQKGKPMRVKSKKSKLRKNAVEGVSIAVGKNSSRSLLR